MITKILAKGHKGLPDIEQPLGRLNLFVGPNGAGKTTRTEALSLAILGYVPGVAKQNAEIFNTFGDGVNPLFVGFERDGQSYVRKFSREKETVNQTFSVNKRKESRDKFMMALAGMRMLDLSAFMGLSDQKKIDTIFALFPPEGDLKDLDQRIDRLKDKQNSCQSQIRALETTRERMNTARAQISLPAGTLAEVSGEIEKTEAELAAARNRLQELKIEKSRADAEAQAALDREQIKEEVRGEVLAEQATPQQQPEARGVEQPYRPSPSFRNLSEALAPAPIFPDPAESIQAILDTMNRAGCTACTAILVAKRELKKFRKSEAA
jgi:hypothetical protein